MAAASIIDSGNRLLNYLNKAILKPWKELADVETYKIKKYDDLVRDLVHVHQIQKVDLSLAMVPPNSDAVFVEQRANRSDSSRRLETGPHGLNTDEVFYLHQPQDVWTVLEFADRMDMARTQLRQSNLSLIRRDIWNRPVLTDLKNRLDIYRKDQQLIFDSLDRSYSTIRDRVKVWLEPIATLAIGQIRNRTEMAILGLGVGNLTRIHDSIVAINKERTHSSQHMLTTVMVWRDRYIGNGDFFTRRTGKIFSAVTQIYENQLDFLDRGVRFPKNFR